MATGNPPDFKTVPRAELDVLYSPSRWSKKLPPEVIVHNHVKVIREATQRVKEEVKHTLDIAYGNGGPGETIDIYYPSQECTDDQSVVIYIHGGYWTDLEKDDYGYVCRPFAKEGITVAMVNFDNAPKGTMTTIVDQCRRACLHVARTFPHKRLYLGGHSAGAHLSACLLSTDWSALGEELVFHGAILLSGIYDLEPIRLSCVNDPLNLTNLEVMDYSPQLLIERVKANLHADFRCLIAHGNQESPEFKRQGLEYNNGLVSVGVASSVVEVEGEDHFTLGERLQDYEYSLGKQLVQLVRH